MNETRFRNYLRKKFENDFIVMQIESGSTCPGIPDTFILQKETNRCAWIELKYSEKEKQNKIDLRKEQVVWHRNYSRLGGISFIMLRTSECIHTWDGEDARELKNGIDIFSIPHHSIKCNGSISFLIEYIKNSL